MAGSYKTPGIYVEEISTLPASVAQVETAIPAFIGYTQVHPAEANGIAVERISSMKEYIEHFGGPATPKIKAVINETTEGGKTTSRSISAELESALKFKMFYSVRMYFDNGGGPCYIISVGDYQTAPAKQKLLNGLADLEKEDEPTLIAFPDANALSVAPDFYELYARALDQCNKLQDRFVLVDIKGEVEEMRDTLASDYMMYAAAYYPDLHSTLSYEYLDKEVSITHKVNGSDGALNGKKLNEIQTAPAPAPESISGDLATGLSSAGEAIAAIKKLTSVAAVDAFMVGETRPTVVQEAANRKAALNASQSNNSYNNEVYNQVKKELTKLTVILPPSSAMAGVYARVDRDRGVWKAPANVTVADVIKPTVKITNEMQENLNVDPTSGKSVNAIRTFAGKGVLVWGARTLDGNNNEWKYIPVRRLFNMVEESLRKATSWVVFEPNDANTWVRVKAQIENFLISLWKSGALAGASPDAAFHVNVGLGSTMTAQDILEGKHDHRDRNRCGSPGLNSSSCAFLTSSRNKQLITKTTIKHLSIWLNFHYPFFTSR